MKKLSMLIGTFLLLILTGCFTQESDLLEQRYVEISLQLENGEVTEMDTIKEMLTDYEFYEEEFEGALPEISGSLIETITIYQFSNESETLTLLGSESMPNQVINLMYEFNDGDTILMMSNHTEKDERKLQVGVYTSNLKLETQVSDILVTQPGVLLESYNELNKEYSDKGTLTVTKIKEILNQEPIVYVNERPGEVYYEFNQAESTEKIGAYARKDTEEVIELTYVPTSNTSSFIKNTVKSELLNLGKGTKFVINGYVDNIELQQDIISLFVEER